MLNQKNKILIVDDIELNRAILCELFASDYQILEAENGEQAIEVMEQHQAEVAVVLMDIVMPVMDGLKAIEIMNQKHLLDRVPTFLITADSSNESVSKGFSLGVADVILKPFNLANICQRVNNMIELYEYRYKLEDLVSEQTKEIEESNAKLRDFNVSMVDTLGAIIEFRDRDSGEHVRRIRLLTKVIASELGRQYEEFKMSEADIEDMSMAAVLHDIGKIAIPDYILNKPGKLSLDECAIMKEHNLYGCNILESIASLKVDSKKYKFYYDSCRSHHEKWDGSGYPDGLIGNEIPLCAQIVALADCYDALTSQRCYKDAYTHEKAVEMIINGECGLLNPKLVKCFEILAPSLQELLKSEKSVKQLTSHYITAPKLPKKQLVDSELEMQNRVASLLEFENRKRHLLFAMSEDIFFDYDIARDVISFSENYAKVFGDAVVIGDARNYLAQKTHISSIDYDALFKAKQELTAIEPSCMREIVIIDKNGKDCWYRLYLHSVWDLDDSTKLLSLVGRLISVSDMTREISLWKKQAETDSLTKLGNRAYGERRVQEMLYDENVVNAIVMMIDIDNFKLINDRYGHLVGDEVLSDIGKELNRQFRLNDIVCRIGGDEFLVIMSNVKSEKLLMIKASDLNESLKQISLKHEINVPISLSVGAVFYPEDGTDRDKLFDKVDKALYEAKKLGKNRCVVYHKKLESAPFFSQLTAIDR